MAETMDAISLLKADHKQVSDLFKEYEDAKGDGRKQKLALEICKQLTVHAQIEEEIFYPACEGKVDEDDVKEAQVEHDGAKVLIAEIEQSKPSNEFYDAKVKVLQEQIDHHVGEEERLMVGIFSQAKRNGVDMDAVGDQLAARKAELLKEIGKGPLPTPELATMTKTTLA